MAIQNTQEFKRTELSLLRRLVNHFYQAHATNWRTDYCNSQQESSKKKMSVGKHLTPVLRSFEKNLLRAPFAAVPRNRVPFKGATRFTESLILATTAPHAILWFRAKTHKATEESDGNDYHGSYLQK
ncbi:hypothetical protein CDAR_177001 [Caerostris darwini]|uniref:Uncharacterized protein n=1 Tax=Caerostris darwini TaxID=1538125 RepID=A0AAV4UB67_9ARAC|nr:hypothetical protein CDAR_177001 [Caerostris darwini]